MLRKVLTVIFSLFYSVLCTTTLANTVNFTVNVAPAEIGRAYTPEQAATWCEIVRTYAVRKDPKTGFTPTLSCQFSPRQLALSFSVKYNPVSIPVEIDNRVSCNILAYYTNSSGNSDSTNSFPVYASKKISVMSGTQLHIREKISYGKSDYLDIPFPSSPKTHAVVTCRSNHAGACGLGTKLSCDMSIVW